MKHCRALTIVELAVVTGITAVMVGITVPAVIAVKTSGQKTVCLGNMKTLTAGITMFADENNGCLPKEDRNLSKNLLKPDYFRGDVFNQLKIPEGSWKCPENPIFGTVNAASHGSEYDFGIKNKATSYFYLANGYDKLSASPEPTDPNKIRPTRIDSQNANRVLFADIVSWNASFQTWNINHQKENPGRSPVIISGGNLGYVSGKGHWQGAGHYPKFLEIDPNPRGNAESVHDTSNLLYSHRYWW